MGITYNEAAGIFKLDGADVTYAFMVDKNGRLAHLYFGKKTASDDFEYLYRPTVRSFAPYPQGGKPTDSGDMLPQEFSGFGTGDFRTAGFIVKNAAGNCATDPRYVDFRIFPGKPTLPGLPATFGDNATTLEVTLEDKTTGMRFILRYSVFEDSNVIARSVKAVNAGSERACLKKISSCTFDLYEGELDFIHFWGTHCRERNLERAPLLHGVQSCGSVRGLSSHTQSPSFILAEPDAGEFSGRVYGATFLYSGNFLIEAERDQFDLVRTQVSIHPDTFEWCLEPNEEFTAPEVLLSMSDAGFDGMARNFHQAIRKHLIRSYWNDRKRPILVNNWEGTYFDFNTKKLISIAKDAAALGIEMLVLDDGWFGCRDTDDNSLGDWFVYEKKLPGGLKFLVDEVNKLGLKFGLWFEPEMVSAKSKLYEAHPDWCLHIPNRAKCESRQQLVLDMSRPEVVDYLFTTICKVLDSANIEYIKWDANRHLTEVASPALPPERQLEVAHRFVLGTYRLHELLLERYPKLLIEGCSGGGGRFDAGMLYYVPQIWTSDDSDAIERLKIQYSTSFFFPCSTMGAHVSDSPNHQTGRSTPFNTRGVVAMSGTFGYELDLNKMDEEERAMIVKQVADYHRFNPIVAQGELHRLTDPFKNIYYTIWMHVAPDKSKFLLNYVQSRCIPHGPLRQVRLRGLDPKRNYRNEADGKVYPGELLMEAGFPLPQFSWNADGESMQFYFEEVAK